MVAATTVTVLRRRRRARHRCRPAPIRWSARSGRTGRPGRTHWRRAVDEVVRKCLAGPEFLCRTATVGARGQQAGGGAAGGVGVVRPARARSMLPAAARRSVLAARPRAPVRPAWDFRTGATSPGGQARARRRHWLRRGTAVRGLAARGGVSRPFVVRADRRTGRQERSDQEHEEPLHHRSPCASAMEGSRAAPRSSTVAVRP